MPDRVVHVVRKKSRGQHAWVFSNEVTQAEGNPGPGDTVQVFDRQTRSIAGSGPALSTDWHQPTVNMLVTQALLGNQGFSYGRMTRDDAIKEISWAAAPIRDPKGAIMGAVLTEKVRENSALFRAATSSFFSSTLRSMVRTFT